MLYLRAMADVGASTRQFDTFCSLARAGTSVEGGLVRTGVPAHVRAFVAHTMTLAQSGSTEEVLAAFFYGREDIIPGDVSALPSTPLPVPGVGRPRWLVELIRCRAGESADFELEACDATGHLRLPADLVHRSDQAEGGQYSASA
jgi:hypothetical protein